MKPAVNPTLGRTGANPIAGHSQKLNMARSDGQAACPLMAEQMIPLYQLYKHSEQVQFVSISVDPERDSLPRLREYARGLGVTDNRWVFLRAPIDSVIWLAEDGFMVSGDFPGGHSTKFILVDQQGRIRGYFDYDDPHQIELLKVDIKELARQNR